MPMASRRSLASWSAALTLACGCGDSGGSDSEGATAGTEASAAAGSSSQSENDGPTASAGSGSGTSAPTSAGASSGGAGPLPPSAESPFIVVDQFGYRPNAAKIAVIRDPQVGFDAEASFRPGSRYAIVSVEGDVPLLEGTPVPWAEGGTHEGSGDAAWWFDFSALTTPGQYYVLDLDHAVRSPVFAVGDDVYDEVLRQAVRTFFYQRAGFAKEPPYADEAWADGASHLAAGQDAEARLYSAPEDASTERDLSGGWYDAGDQNKYTRWTAGYVAAMLVSYQENPAAFGDDFGIPESGNGTADLLDEARWGMDWLIRMQEDDGSVLSIVGVESASPPSSASEPSLYGSASTTATMATAGAFALGAIVYGEHGDASYAAELEARAIEAWTWARANPDVLFYNNDADAGTSGLGAGQQETDDYGRLMDALAAAVYLYELTGEAEYRDFVAENHTAAHLVEWGFAYPFETATQDVLLRYAELPDVDPEVTDRIRSAFVDSMLTGEDNLPAFTSAADPYLAHLSDANYTWGSNAVKSHAASSLLALAKLAPESETVARDAAEHYLHYLHGVNPLGLVYLSNMGDFGAERSATQFYHSWFVDGSPAWDQVGVSTFGPAPGFLVGGPNPSYHWDGCCDTSCGSAANDALCGDAPPSPPAGQPPQKSYLDFNDGWPISSWSVTENSNGYQLAYIRLLSSFVGG